MMKVQTTIKSGKGKSRYKGSESDAKKQKNKTREKTRDTVFWCKWKGVARDTLDDLTGERVREFDGMRWGTWIVAPEGESNGRLEHLAWYSVAMQMVKPDPRPRRVVTRIAPDNDGTITVESLTEGNDSFVPDTFVALSIQEAQERMHLDGIHPLGYRDQMRGVSRFATSGTTNLLPNYPLKTAHLRMNPASFPQNINSDEDEEDDSESDSDSDDEIFGEEKKKKKVNA